MGCPDNGQRSMPGLVGVVDFHRKTHIGDLLPRMAGSVRYKDWYTSHLFIDETESVGLGRVGPVIYNPQPQPFFNKDKSLAVLMEGELYDTDPLRRELLQKGSRFEVYNDPELILRLYEAYGEAFIFHLKGAFALAIWNQKRQRLLIATDRFGLRPLYYAWVNGKLLFSTEIKAILEDRSLSKSLDYEAVVDFFSNRYILSDKTFFEHVKLFPNASVLSFEGPSGRLELKPYWSFSDIPARSCGIYGTAIKTNALRDLAAEAGHLFNQAIHRQAQGNYALGAYLSGGLDSRTIVGLVRKKGYPLRTATWGLPNCYDAKFAGRVADQVHSNHFLFKFDENWFKTFPQEAVEGVRITDGLLSVFHLPSPTMLEIFRKEAQVNLLGYFGDVILGASFLSAPKMAPFLTPLKREKARPLVYKWTNQIFQEKDLLRLFLEPHARRMKGLAFPSIHQEWSKFEQLPADKRLDYYAIVNRGRRWIAEGYKIVRTYMEDRSPFFDYDFFEFIYSLPSSIRLNHRLYIEILKQELPELLEIPWQKTGRPPKPIGPGAKLQMGLDKLVDKMNQLLNIPPGMSKDCKRFDVWTRKELRDFTEGILLNRRTLDRGYYDPGYVKELISRHLSRRVDLSEHLGIMITFELWHREFMDP